MMRIFGVTKSPKIFQQIAGKEGKSMENYKDDDGQIGLAKGRTVGLWIEPGWMTCTDKHDGKSANTT